jgi:hypothetical protein
MKNHISRNEIEVSFMIIEYFGEINMEMFIE